MAQWITRLPTEQKIPGSSPGWFGKLLFIFTKCCVKLTDTAVELVKSTVRKPSESHGRCQRCVYGLQSWPKVLRMTQIQIFTKFATSVSLDIFVICYYGRLKYITII